jgi:phosphatidylserine decarboxylase
MRPIDTEAEVVMPVDSWPKGLWQIDSNNQLVYPENVYVKTAKLSDIGALIGKDSKYATAFAGGTLTHTFLDVNDYHRYHFPVSGTITELRNIPAIDAAGGITIWDAEAQRYRLECDIPGWQSIETRGLVVIDTHEYGLVAVLPIGMSQISSVNFVPELAVGQEVHKGDLLGWFLFGGSDMVYLFQKDAHFELTTTEHLLMGQQMATLSK